MTRKHYDTNLMDIQQKLGKNTGDENRLIGVAFSWDSLPTEYQWRRELLFELSTKRIRSACRFSRDSVELTLIVD